MLLENEELYKEIIENYEKIFKRFLKSFPKSILKEHLIKHKILKEDYLTGECEMVKKRRGKRGEGEKEDDKK